MQFLLAQNLILISPEALLAYCDCSFATNCFLKQSQHSNSVHHAIVNTNHTVMILL